jgi:DNA-binding NarL/FixJ family response regulator
VRSNRNTFGAAGFLYKDVDPDALVRAVRWIARLLHVSEKTVKTHVSSVLAKLGVADRTQAAVVAVRLAGG